MPAFRPSVHGFPFVNWFPPGTPVVEIPTPFGHLPIGNANGGLCGGMAFAAVDLFTLGRPVPTEPTPAVVKYLCRRLLASFNLPFGVTRYYDWMRRPSATRRWAGVPVLAGLGERTAGEWPKVKAVLDAGGLVPLGLVKAHSFDPRLLGQNHQVLAHNYTFDEPTGDLTVRIYDPNFPGDDSTALVTNLGDPAAGIRVTHTGEGDTVRGFFLTEYRRPGAVPMFG